MAFNASGLTAIAIQDDGGSEIHIEINQERSKKKLQVYVDGIEKSFIENHLWWQDFDGASVLNLHNELEAQNNLTVITSSGVGLQVSYHEPGLLGLIVSSPLDLKNKIQGLLGNWDDNSENDLTPQNQGKPIDPKNRKEIHYNFGSTWQVTDVQTLFMYREQKNWSYYKKGDFTPTFEVPGDDSDANNICGNDFECKFDYAVTKNKQLAEITLQSQVKLKIVCKIFADVDISEKG